MFVYMYVYVNVYMFVMVYIKSKYMLHVLATLLKLMNMQIINIQLGQGKAMNMETHIMCLAI